MSNVALLGCIVFVIIIFVIDSKNRKPAPKTTIVPFLWFLFGSSRPLSVWLTGGHETVTRASLIEGNPIDRNFLVVLMFIGIIILIKRGIDFKSIVKKNGWIFFLFFFIGLSALWSNYPFASLRRWFRMLGDIVIALVILTEDDPEETIRVVFRRCAFIAFPFSILLIRYFPYLGRSWSRSGAQYSWIGITPHKNLLGIICFVYILAFIFSLLTEKNKKIRNINILFILMGLYLLNGSPHAKSNTSIMLFILGFVLMIVIFYYKKDLKKLMRIIILVIVLLYIEETIVKALFGQSLLEMVVLISGRDLSLTGRTDIWMALIEIGLRRPLLGSGIGAFWIDNLSNRAFTLLYWQIQSAHNGYLSVFLNLGIVGLIIFFFIFKQAYTNILSIREKDKNMLCIRLVYFILILLHNWTESTYLQATSVLWVLFLLVSMQIPANTVNEERIGGKI